MDERDHEALSELKAKVGELTSSVIKLTTSVELNTTFHASTIARMERRIEKLEGFTFGSEREVGVKTRLASLETSHDRRQKWHWLWAGGLVGMLAYWLRWVWEHLDFNSPPGGGPT